MITLGVDVGTTHLKVLAFDTDADTEAGTDAGTLAVETAPTPAFHDYQGDARSASAVLDAVIRLVGVVVSRLAHPADIRALGVASVGEEVVLLDRDGAPVADVIAWFDPRGTDEAAAFRSGPGAHLTLSRRWPPDPTFSLFKLLWMAAHAPADLARSTTWTDLGDYVLAGLGGLGGDVVMDWSHASRAGAFDLLERRWDEATLAAAGLDGIRFPRLVPSGSIVGAISAEATRRTGSPEGVGLVAGGHDHLVAAFGVGSDDPDDVFLSAGTSEAHLALTSSPVAGLQGRYPVDQGCHVLGEDYYLHVNTHAGRVFADWRSRLYEGVDDAAMYAEVEAIPPDAAVPAFELLDDLRTGRFVAGDPDIDEAHRAVLMLAVLSGLARRSADVVAFLEELRGRPFRRIVATGHPTRIPLWRRLREAAYGREIVPVEALEGAALGAALLAARAVSG